MLFGIYGSRFRVFFYVAFPTSNVFGVKPMINLGEKVMGSVRRRDVEASQHHNI
jgi:hypothetical protein